MSAVVDEVTRTPNPRVGSVPVPVLGGWAPARGLWVASIVTAAALVLAVVSARSTRRGDPMETIRGTA